MHILFESLGLDIEAASEKNAAARFAASACDYADVSIVVPAHVAERAAASVPEARVLAVEYHPPRLPLNSGLHYTYPLFAARARRALAQSSLKPDLVHRLNPFAIRHPSAFQNLGIPLVLGPLGGSTLPSAFVSGPRELALGLLKASDTIRLSVPGSLRGTYESANAIGCSTQALAMRLPARFHSRCVRLCEGVDTDLFVAPPPAASAQLLFVGRLIPYKGLDCLLQALSRCTDHSWSLRVAGDGPLGPSLRQLSVNLGIEDRVAWLGTVPREEVLREYRACSIVCSPGYNESTGNVVMEALSCGRPVLVADWAGPGELCPDNAGVKVAIGSRGDYISGLEQESAASYLTATGAQSWAAWVGNMRCENYHGTRPLRDSDKSMREYCPMPPDSTVEPLSSHEWHQQILVDVYHRLNRMVFRDVRTPQLP